MRHPSTRQAQPTARSLPSCLERPSACSQPASPLGRESSSLSSSQLSAPSSNSACSGFLPAVLRRERPPVVCRSAVAASAAAAARGGDASSALRFLPVLPPACSAAATRSASAGGGPPARCSTVPTGAPLSLSTASAMAWSLTAALRSAEPPPWRGSARRPLALVPARMAGGCGCQGTVIRWGQPPKARAFCL